METVIQVTPENVGDIIKELPLYEVKDNKHFKLECATKLDLSWFMFRDFSTIAYQYSSGYTAYKRGGWIELEVDGKFIYSTTIY